MKDALEVTRSNPCVQVTQHVWGLAARGSSEGAFSLPRSRGFILTAVQRKERWASGGLSSNTG